MTERPYEKRLNPVAGVELREDENTGAPILTGYPSTYNDQYRVGHFAERVAPDSFIRTMAGNPDVRLLVDHEGQPLARTKSGTLTLNPSDPHGFYAHAPLEPTDPDVQRLLPKMRRGDLDQMSFAFRVPAGGDEWDYSGEIPLRTIREVNMQGGDVSVVTYPANGNTSVSVRAIDSQDASLVLVDGMLRSIRSGVKLGRCHLDLLDQVVEEVREASGLYRAQMTAASIDDLPDSDFAYIEPGGKKDDDGKTVPRSLRHFPIQDADHVRNALSRAPQSPFGEKAMPKIIAAAKKFGIAVAEHNSTTALDLALRIAAGISLHR